jgi:G3E family GTPase
LILSILASLAQPKRPFDLAESRMRLTVLGGFLGSGKTTWLRHQLHAGVFKGAYVIVNEAAETPVDDALLQGSSKLSVLAGGCACCVGKADLILLLRKICDDRSKLVSSAQRLERIVLETSGLADPAPIVDAIRNDPILVHHIIVSEILVTVDALHALSQLRSEPLGRRQIEIADCMMITKLDEATESDLAKLLATLRVLNPGAKMFGSVKGTETTLPTFDNVKPEELTEIQTESELPPIFPSKLAINDTIDWTAFSVWLSALLHARGNDVMRVKGVVQTPAGRLLVQTVRKIVQSPEILPEQTDDQPREDNTIVVIGRGYRAEDLSRSLDYFAGHAQS